MGRFGFEKREKVSALRVLLTTLCFVLLALIFCGIIILFSGFDPVSVYREMFTKSFLSQKGTQKMFTSSLPLIFCSLGVALSFRMNLNNIGAEGQYAIGVIAGGALVMYGPKVTGFPGLLLLGLCCFLGGALWALGPALLRAYWNINESITTLLMNYIALEVLTFLCLGPWKMKGQNVAQTERIPEGLDLPSIPVGGFEISYGIILGVLAAVLIYVVLHSTARGYELRVISHSEKSALYAGMDIRKNIITVLCVSGGFAGLGAFAQYSGVTHRIMEGMPNGVGYTAIVVAYLSRLNPLTVVLVSLLFVGLQNSTVYVQIMGVSVRIASMMQGAIMLFVIAGDFFQRYRLTVTKEVRA